MESTITLAFYTDEENFILGKCDLSIYPSIFNSLIPVSQVTSLLQRHVND